MSARPCLCSILIVLQYSDSNLGSTPWQTRSRSDMVFLNHDALCRSIWDNGLSSTKDWPNDATTRPRYAGRVPGRFQS